MKGNSASLLVVALCLIAASLSAAEIIAHRGASHDAPENTLSAFKLGYEQGADAGELDIRLTKDGRIIAMHDADASRTAGVKGKIVERTIEEIRTLEVGKWGQWKDGKFSEKVPLLSEVLALIPDGRRMFIEIKVREEILPELKRVITASGRKPEQLPIITFDYGTARAAKARFPKHEVSWLASYEKDKTTGKLPDIEELILKAKAAGLDGLDLNFKFPIDKSFTKKVHDAGLKLYTWTVNDPAIARLHADAGVDGITTDRPQWLREQLKTP
jgi:glycerophosphoryl diester phosphodiesterase